MRDGTDPAGVDAFANVIGELGLVSNTPFPKVILVSSTVAGEGKSILVSNLADAYSAQDRSVVILDLDLRRPTQQLLHSTQGKGGFMPWIRAGFPMGGLLEPGGVLGLQQLSSRVALIPAGGEEKGASHNLDGPQMTELLVRLRARFDVVLIDTPPAGLFQDALQLGRRADEVILVARVARAPLSHVRKIILDFENAKAPITGVVINGYSPRVADKRLAYSVRSGRSAYYGRPVSHGVVAAHAVADLHGHPLGTGDQPTA